MEMQVEATRETTAHLLKGMQSRTDRVTCWETWELSHTGDSNVALFVWKMFGGFFKNEMDVSDVACLSLPGPHPGEMGILCCGSAGARACAEALPVTTQQPETARCPSAGERESGPGAAAQDASQ